MAATCSKDVESDVKTPLLKDIESFPKYVDDANDNSIERMNGAHDNRTFDVKLKEAFDGFIKTFTDYDFENNPITRFIDQVACLKTCTSACCIAIQAAFAALPIAMVVIGVIHLNDCPLERFIPIYLYVAGSFAIAHILINAIAMLWPGRTLLQLLIGLMSLFSIAWFIAGSVWVYRSNSVLNTDTPESPNYCHPSAYYLAFWVITSMYAVFGTFVFILGLVGLIGCCYLCNLCCQVSSCLTMPKVDKKPQQENPERFLEESVEKGILTPSTSGGATVRVDDSIGIYAQSKATDEQSRDDISIYS